jgi:hypothetical protein
MKSGPRRGFETESARHRTTITPRSRRMHVVSIHVCRAVGLKSKSGRRPRDSGSVISWLSLLAEAAMVH